MITRRHQHGFSAVELLITLFIATAMIGSAYQLYIVILKDGNDARNQAQASDIAYNYIRQYSALATSPCSAVTPTPTPVIPAGSALQNASINATITCPYGTSSFTTLVQVTVNYGYQSPQQGVTHAIFTN